MRIENGESMLFTYISTLVDSWSIVTFIWNVRIEDSAVKNHKDLLRNMFSRVASPTVKFSRTSVAFVEY